LATDLYGTRRCAYLLKFQVVQKPGVLLSEGSAALTLLKLRLVTKRS